MKKNILYSKKNLTFQKRYELLKFQEIPCLRDTIFAAIAGYISWHKLQLQDLLMPWFVDKSP